MSPIHYSSGAAPSLIFRYQTDLKASDITSLRSEVDEIWLKFQIDADRGNFSSAIISANEVPHGFIFKKASGYNFVYEESANGAWRRL
jgi:hypothetical protein